MGALIILTAALAAAQTAAPAGSAASTDTAKASKVGQSSYVDVEAGAGYSSNPLLSLNSDNGSAYGRVDVHAVHVAAMARRHRSAARLRHVADIERREMRCLRGVAQPLDIGDRVGVPVIAVAAEADRRIAGTVGGQRGGAGEAAIGRSTDDSRRARRRPERRAPRRFAGAGRQGENCEQRDCEGASRQAFAAVSFDFAQDEGRCG